MSVLSPRFPAADLRNGRLRHPEALGDFFARSGGLRNRPRPSASSLGSHAVSVAACHALRVKARRMFVAAPRQFRMNPERMGVTARDATVPDGVHPVLKSGSPSEIMLSVVRRITVPVGYLMSVGRLLTMECATCNRVRVEHRPLSFDKEGYARITRSLADGLGQNLQSPIATIMHSSPDAAKAGDLVFLSYSDREPFFNVFHTHVVRKIASNIKGLTARRAEEAAIYRGDT